MDKTSISQIATVAANLSGVAAGLSERSRHNVYKVSQGEKYWLEVRVSPERLKEWCTHLLNQANTLLKVIEEDCG